MRRPSLRLLASCRSSSRLSRRTRNARWFHESHPALSGHSRWSTIKHDKAKNDAAKNRQRSAFSQEIATASRLFGADPNSNPRLADLISKAKKNGFAKQSIEAAVARGQGKSASGAALEAVTIEAIMPGNIGVVIDCETDSRLRTLQQVRLVIKKHGGAASPSSYLFAKRGRITFEAKPGVGADEVFESALEAGALDVGDSEDSVLVYCEPTQVKDVGTTVGQACGLQISSSEIVWTPNPELVVPLQDSEVAANFSKFIDDLHENDASVQGVYMNIVRGEAEEGPWLDLMAKLST